jgi:hypothetical protein
MEIRYTHTAEDSLNWMRATPAPPWSMFLFILLLALLFLVGIYLVGHDYAVVGWAWLALSVALGIAVYEVPRVQARRAIATNPSVQGEIVWTLDDTGTAATFPTGRSWMEWRAYTKYKETDYVFLLFYTSGRSAVIPKRVMSPEQVQELRSLLRAQIRRQ